MVNLIQWIEPDSAFGWTHIRIERGTAQAGPFSELTSTDITGYTASGLPLGSPQITQAKDNTGTAAHWYRMRFYDGTEFSDYSEPLKAFDFRGYCTIEDFRAFSNIQDPEYTDSQIQVLIDTVTTTIDRLTGRTWQGIQTVTDAYLDGDGTNLIQLHHGDIGSLTAISVDSSESGTYTTISPSTEVFLYAEEGMIALKKTAPVTKFPDNPQSVLVSYTWGNEDPTPQVRQLAMLMIADMLSPDETGRRKELIEMHMNALARPQFRSVF